MSELGLRERKKQRTRDAIAVTARQLFETRGFDDVTVAEIARKTDVAEKTVFNYFPTKEDLFYYGMQSFEEELLAAVRDRPPGETVVRAFRRFLTQPRGLLVPSRGREAWAARQRLRRIQQTIARSPSLLAREQEIFRRYTQSLAALLAEETDAPPGDVTPTVVASALLGAHRALVAYVRWRVLAQDDEPTRLARDLRAQAERALDLLEHGLGRYAPRRVTAG